MDTPKRSVQRIPGTLVTMLEVTAGLGGAVPPRVVRELAAEISERRQSVEKTQREGAAARRGEYKIAPEVVRTAVAQRARRYPTEPASANKKAVAAALGVSIRTITRSLKR